MLVRARNPNCKSYRAGVALHQPWLKFETFYADLGPRPGRGFILCRLDPDVGFVPGNVQWMTRKEWGLLQRRHKMPASR